MWISKAIGYSSIIIFIYIFLFYILFNITKINPTDTNKNKTKKVKKIFIFLFSLIWIIFSILEFTGFRYDYAAGQHSIIPTAIDSDFWGNYKVYYKTSLYEPSSYESFYYIEKDRVDLIKTIQNCIKNQQQIIVYYNNWIGFKGLSSPQSSPIIKIELLNM